MSRVLVIGNGAAGAFSAWLLAKGGWEVTLVGRGTSSTALSTGCLRSAPKLCRDEIMEFLGNDDLPWATDGREGISRIGTSYRCWMSPSHSTWNDGGAPKSVAVAGIGEHPSLPVRTTAAMLNRRGIKAIPFIMPVQVPPEAPLSSRFRDEEAWEVMAAELEQLSAEAILLPAMVSLRDYCRLDQLERRCGREILEAVTPLGAPGLRLADLMLSKAKEAGVTVWDGRKVIDLDVSNGAVREAKVLGGSEVRLVALDALVVATGGPLVDGLNIDGRELTDPFGRFQVTGHEDALRGGYDNRNGRLVSSDGQVIVNAVGAGDCLSSKGREYGHGLNQALESAYRAVQTLEGS